MGAVEVEGRTRFPPGDLNELDTLAGARNVVYLVQFDYKVADDSRIMPI